MQNVKLNKKGQVVGQNEKEVIACAKKELKDDFYVYKKGKNYYGQAAKPVYAMIPDNARIVLKKDKGWKELDPVASTYVIYEGTKLTKMTMLSDRIYAKNRKEGVKLETMWQVPKQFKKFLALIETLRK